MVIGMNKAFGMFFVEYIEAFDSSSSMILDYTYMKD
jgi:hypothetical protein